MVECTLVVSLVLADKLQVPQFQEHIDSAHQHLDEPLLHLIRPVIQILVASCPWSLISPLDVFSLSYRLLAVFGEGTRCLV